VISKMDIGIYSVVSIRNTGGYPVMSIRKPNRAATDFMFMGQCIVRYRGGVYDQQDATNSQYLLLEASVTSVGTEHDKQ
jgi:hypothetical protein